MIPVRPRTLVRPAGLLVLVALAACQAPGTGNCWSTSEDPEHLAERPSPLDSALVELGDATAKVCYSRPSAKERQVMGGLVPTGQIWRFGANEATALHVPFPAEIGSVRVDPGSYTLYTVPGEEAWTFTVNRAWERWGIPVDSVVTVDDIGSFTVAPESIDEMVETFTIYFDDTTGGATSLVAEWEFTRLRIPVRRVEG